MDVLFLVVKQAAWKMGKFTIISEADLTFAYKNLPFFQYSFIQMTFYIKLTHPIRVVTPFAHPLDLLC